RSHGVGPGPRRGHFGARCRRGRFHPSGHLRVTPGPPRLRSVAGMQVNSRYEIRVQGVLDGRWTAWFEGMQLLGDGSQTIISGPLADQAALHGVLTRLCDLGLVLISVRRLDPDCPPPRGPSTRAQRHEEKAMHPAFLELLAAERIQTMIARADNVRRVRQARLAARPSAHRRAGAAQPLTEPDDVPSAQRETVRIS